MSDTSRAKYAAVAAAIEKRSREARQRELAARRDREALAACLRHWMRAENGDEDWLGLRLHLRPHVIRDLLRGNETPSSVRAGVMFQLERLGYDILHLYRCPITQQVWREKTGAPTSRGEWLWWLAERNLRPITLTEVQP